METRGTSVCCGLLMSVIYIYLLPHTGAVLSPGSIYPLNAPILYAPPRPRRSSSDTLILVAPPQDSLLKYEATTQNIYASGCSDEEVSLQCPLNHRVAIKRLFYGVKRTWDCQHGQVPRKKECCHAAHTDCLVNDDSKYPTLNTHCSGYRQCTIMVQKVPTANHQCPNASHTDYMTVIYDCVPEADIAMFCSDDVKKGKTLYLSNLEYPSSIQAQKANCMCMVRTEGGSEGVNIHAIDVLLAWSQHGPRSCSKELAINDENGYRRDIQCGHRGYYGFRTIYTRPVHNVTLTLKSSAIRGSAFVWLQAKATDDDDQVEIFCGDKLRQLLLLARQEAESRHRKNGGKGNQTTSGNDKGQGKNSTRPYSPHTASVSSSLAAIIGGIVAAGIVLIAIVIIAIAVHCKRVQQRKQKSKQTLNLYPAVTNGEATSLASYCHYNDYDDEHYSSINRSPLKMASLTESDIATTHARTNGFVTLSKAEHQNHGNLRREELASQTLPNRPSITSSPSSPSSPSGARDSLLADPSYTGHLSLRICRPNGQVHNADVHDGLQTLPDSRYGKILVSGPKSPLGKRSKSVTFSQPVAMVTPLPSGSEESVDDGPLLGGEAEEGEGEEDMHKDSSLSSLEDGNYDNLSKVIIPDRPLSPSQVQTMPIYRTSPKLGSPQRSPVTMTVPRSLSTFRSQEPEVGQEMTADCEELPVPLPSPPHPIINGDMYAVVHKKPVPVPVLHPLKQNAQLYETGV